MSNSSQVHTHGMLQTLQNERNYRLLTKQFMFDNICEHKRTQLSCLDYWLVTPEVAGSCPIVLSVTDSKKPHRLAMYRDDLQAMRGRIRGTPLSQ